MKLPSNFETEIASAFYDKEITKYTSTVETDDEGWARVVESASSETFMGNVRFDNLAHIQEDYGIQEVVDIVISTHESIANGQLIEYDNVLYKIIRAIPYDSHIMLFGQMQNENQYQSA